MESKLELRQPRCHRCVHVRSRDSLQWLGLWASPSVPSRGLDADSQVGIDTAMMDCLNCWSTFACTLSRRFGYSAAAVRSFFLPPINRCNAVVVFAIQAGSNVSSGRVGKRRHSAAAIGSFTRAVKRMEPKLELRQPTRHRCDHVRSCVSLPRPGPEKKRANGWLLSGERLTAFSVPSRGSGRVGALQPKLKDDQRAQTVTGFACNARSSREAPVCVSRLVQLAL